MEFRDALKALRIELGLIQADIADALHINIATVARWEQGKTAPNRSIGIALLNYARSRSASVDTLNNLESTMGNAAREKLSNRKNALFTVEHATISELVEDAAFPIYVSDLTDDGLLYVNRSAERLLGKSRDILVGCKCYERIMNRDTPCEFCGKNSLSESVFTDCENYSLPDGSVYRTQGKLVRWNNRCAQIRYLLDRETPVGQRPETVNNPAAAIPVCEDDATGTSPAAPDNTPMTRSSDAESDTHSPVMESLSLNLGNEQSAEQLRAIFGSINGGVSAVIYDDSGAIRLAYANDRYYELFGYTKEQFTHELKGPHETTHPEDREKVAEAFNRIKETRQSATFRYRIIKRDKSIAHLHCNSSVTPMVGSSGYMIFSVLTDITESVQLEREAIVSGRRLEAIMKNMNSAVAAAIVNDDGSVKLLFTNDLHYQMLGYTEEQYQAEVSDPFAHVHPDDLDALRAAVFGLRHVGEEKELQYRIFTRDGKQKTVRAHLSMMDFPDSDRPVQLAVHADITDIVEAQRQLDAQHDRIAALLNDTPGGIAIIEVNPRDVAGTLHTVYYNDRFFSYSGYDRKEYSALLNKNEMAFVFDEDVPRLLGDVAKLCAGETGASLDSTVRCHRKGGGFRWLMLTGQLAERRGDICVIHIVMVDITEMKEEADRRRISEELLHIAAETDQRAIIIYDIKKNCCSVESRTLFPSKYGDTIGDIPQSLLKSGIVAPDSAPELLSMFTRIREGAQKLRVSLQMQSETGSYNWFECGATTVFDREGHPDHAVLVFHNITEQRVKEAVFRKWQQSVHDRPAESYTLFRINLSRSADIDEQDGSLLKISFPERVMPFNTKTKLYADEFIYPDDREAYLKLLDSDTLLAMFYRGEHSASLDYRETDDNGNIMWRRLTVETVEYPNSSDVQAFLMYEDIDEKKKAEIAEREIAEADPLTGTLNRSAFAEKVSDAIITSPDSTYALIMLDMDGFKKLNDTFGHAAGDQALQEVAAVLRSYIRDDDLVCRFGGDEFLVWLHDIPYDAVIGKAAQQICEHIRKAYSQEVLLSASVGIAIYPRDGQNYDDLYRNADKALYKVKQASKGSYAFYSVIGEEETDNLTQALSAMKPSPQSPHGSKRRMLIVDDSEMNRALLKNIFLDEFVIETAKNGAEALIRLRHFGASISVVLLDLIMPGMDGFTVLKRIQTDVDLRTIPVIVVTGDEERATLLKAFELGAAEYVSKPVDTDIIRMRVRSVISKAESERLRAQNSYLMLQRDEEAKYRTVLDSTGTVVVEYDWRNHVFIYDGEISKYIAGKFDHRGLWQVFLSDMVADSSDVKDLQDTLINLAGTRERDRESRLIRLKTPGGEKHWFRVNIYKNVDDFGLTGKLIITFNNVHEEVLTNDRLLFQATRDELTGLYNRVGFLEKATGLIAGRAPGYYVMSCINVEKFQVVNDQYGTDIGDMVLKHIASTIDGFARSNNGICCRYTADKFAALFPAELLNSDKLSDSHRAAASPDCIKRPMRLRIGRCTVDDISLPVSAVLDRAAMAEVLAKERYDTYIINYDESMRDSILHEQQIVGDMADALKSGEFEPWFQPQYNHATGALIGSEALLRWRKDGKIIPPNSFIPVFEKNGFIYEVDRFIWRQVCALLRRWLDEGKNPLPVSVNISRHDMFQEGFVDAITGLLSEYRLPADLLRLEITESAFSAATNVITEIAGKLIDAGFTVEIDDFGSGYSSLNTLKDVPASILKLDMRFFENSENSSRGGNIIESVVRMAKWLNMAVIAEGVEDKTQADYLKSIGCYYIQGYYYSKPLPTAEYESLMCREPVERQLSHTETLESMDSDLFWDPRSMETLIFNSYVGGACIFEVRGSKSETLRYNDQLIHELRGLIPEHADIRDIDIASFLDEASRAKLSTALQRALESGKEAVCELRLTGVGQTEYVRQTSRVIAKSRDSTLYYAVIQNITDQRKLEQERAESAEQLSVIMNSIECGVSASVFHDESNIEIVFANEGFYRLFGYTGEQFGSELSSPAEPILGEDRDRVISTVAGIVRERGSATYEYRCRRRDGSTIRVHTTNTVVSLTGMGDTVLLAVTTDVTALRRAEEQSLETADRLSAVMNSMTSGMTAVTVGDSIRFLFANNRYYQLHGIVKNNCEQNVLRSAMAMIHPDDRGRIRDTVLGMTGAGQSAETKYRVRLPDGTLRYVKMSITVTRLIGIDSPVQVAMYTDVTREQMASDQIRFLNESASGILAQPDSEKAIHDTLAKLLDYFAGERSYIFELDDIKQTSDNTYEICAPGITPEIGRLQGVPYDTQQCWFDAFRTDGFVAISDVAAIDDSETAMREILLVQGISSIIVAPLWRDGELIGYMGVDNPTVAVDQVSQLIALSDYIAVLLTRRDLMNALELGQQTAQNLMDDTPGGFIRMELFEDKNPTIISVNDGMCNLLGMTRNELMQAYGDDAYACLAERGATVAPAEIAEAYASGGQYRSTCQLRKKDGSLFWVMLAGRFVKGEGGRLYLNAYFTDISEQRTIEQFQAELLDNLPFGAAMYEFDGRTLTATHINKRYAEMVNREVDISLPGFSPMDAIHPDDLRIAFDEIRAAISEKRNAMCDIRLLYGADEYRMYRLIARIVPVNNGKYMLYVAYENLSDSRS